MPEAKSLRVWDASECVLMFIDYQDHVMDLIFAQDRRIIELNIRTLAKMAVAFKIPVILSTVGVEMGVERPDHRVPSSGAAACAGYRSIVDERLGRCEVCRGGEGHWPEAIGDVRHLDVGVPHVSGGQRFG